MSENLTRKIQEQKSRQDKIVVAAELLPWSKTNGILSLNACISKSFMWTIRVLSRRRKGKVTNEVLSNFVYYLALSLISHTFQRSLIRNHPTS